MALLLQTVIIGSFNNKCSSGSMLQPAAPPESRMFSQNNWLKEIKGSKSNKDVSNLLIEKKERGVQLNEWRGGNDPISLDKKLLRVRQQVRTRKRIR